MESNDIRCGRVPFGDVTNTLGKFLVNLCTISVAYPGGVVTRFSNILWVLRHQHVGRELKIEG